ncbi:uncharacterized protein LOC125774957 [Anopheles funestus]|uniref:uncharacterized protein LOC125774957 n=1 Tax=Anopheles funestus TaxID=62324 RepID=UPI0020C601B8|nr:uncharacterized protein LOC125774957 [Anopheles funestus]
MEPIDTKEEPRETFMYHLETFSNTINNMVIGYVTFYLSYFSNSEGLGQLFTWNIFLYSISYQFFMAESLLTLYSANSWTNSLLYNNQVPLALDFASLFSLHCNRFFSKKGCRSTTLPQKTKFLVSCFLNTFLKPVNVKKNHYLTGILAFVIEGKPSMALEYSPRSISLQHKNMLITFTTTTIALTLAGIFKNHV